MLEEDAHAAKPPHTRRARGRPKVAPDETQRAHIMDVGRSIFLERGFGRATMDEVAARAHVSKQTLYRFFTNKSDLFAAVVETHRHTMLALPGNYDHLGLEDALKAIVRFDINAEQDRERHALLEVVFYESAAHPELRETVFRHGVEKSRRDLADWIQKRMESGQFVAGDAELVAQILMDMIFGAGRPLRPPGELEDPDARRRRLEKCLSLFLYGIMAR